VQRSPGRADTHTMGTLEVGRWLPGEWPDGGGQPAVDSPGRMV